MCFFFQNLYPDILPAEQAEAQPEEFPQNDGSDNELPGDRSPVRNLSSSPILPPRKRQRIAIDSDSDGEEIAPKIHR